MERFKVNSVPAVFHRNAYHNLTVHEYTSVLDDKNDMFEKMAWSETDQAGVLLRNARNGEFYVSL